MASTPSPQIRRVRTPPTPLHGARHNRFEPDSPRRSNRIHSRDDVRSRSMAAYFSPSPTDLHNRSQKIARKPIIQRTSSQTHSPPSSPISPRRVTETPRIMRHNQDGVKATTDPRPQAHGQSHKLIASAAMFPTPSKTPRKRDQLQQAATNSAARVLFPTQAPDFDNPMPTPRKAHKEKGNLALALESFSEEKVDDGQIQIYTDSRDREPEPAEDDEDNPFVVKKTNRASGAPASAISTRRSTRGKHGMTEQVDDAVSHDKGMVYVFRGKKYFRSFTDSRGNDADETDEADDSMGIDEASDSVELRRQIGVSASRPFTRSSIKPRLLFPPAEEAETEVDEEAMTDIEASVPKPSIATPRKQYRPTTPPTTARKPRRASNLDGSPPSPPTDEPSSQTHNGLSKKGSHFDSWPRRKPSMTGRSASTKRQGEPIERAEGDLAKRTRSSRTS